MKEFNKSYKEIKDLAKSIEALSPYFENKECAFYRGVQYLAEILTDKGRRDNCNLFEGHNHIFNK